ncbi:uncharacterized protein LOC129312696 [Prosopis cineraria]|uniref:uncharacterized protein LOC129312696 n=1 Tax=Prosopis cineraria TaxID=364024 RepID=UPI00240F288D|nr:uncharacterized protein LOC129312696 [Prosopis cineraria]
MASVVFCFLMLSLVDMTKASQDTVTQAKELEVQKLLDKLNKPAVKSLKSPDGDIIDCVHISHQPTFDHPKLKNHKIQMRPTFLPKGIKSYPESKTIDQMWHQSGSCPEGTIPIRRTTKDDIMRESSFQRFGMKDNMSIPNLSESLYSSTNNHEYATAEVVKDIYYGAKAFLNIWKSNVQQRNELSLSQIWVMNQGDNNNVESIEAGWQIHPMLYGDDRPRLFAYWTSDSYERTGCYDLKCSGFVQVTSVVVLGGTLAPISLYDSTQYGINLLIWKDRGTGNWWLRYQNIVVGYWPASMFESLSAESATVIQWGGEVINRKSNGRHTSTEMGSGYFPRAGFGRASYFRDLSVVNENYYLISPNYIRGYASKPRCYDIVLNGYSSDFGAHFFFGGPGRNPYCPI